MNVEKQLCNYVQRRAPNVSTEKHLAHEITVIHLSSSYAFATTLHCSLESPCQTKNNDSPTIQLLLLSTVKALARAYNYKKII